MGGGPVVAGRRTADVSTARRGAFTALTVLLGVGVGLGFFAWPSLVLGWFEGGERIIHRVHDVGWGLVTGVLLAVPAILQIRRPEWKDAAWQQIAVVTLAFVVESLVAGLSGVESLTFVLFVVFTALLAWLHPARPYLFRFQRPNWPLASLAVAAAIPLIPYALRMASLQRNGSPNDPHVKELHWATMGTLALSILLVALLASLRTRGFRIPAWLAGLTAILFGVASVVFPDYPGAEGVAWGIVAIVGGVTFIAVAEWEARRRTRSLGP